MGSCRLELYSPCLLNLCLGVRSASKITTENPYASYVSALVNRIQCSDTSGCECKRDSAQPVIDGGRMEVRGFKTAAVAAGIKADGVLDLALICSDSPGIAAAVFTQNTFIAPPLIVSRKHLEETNHRARALIVNS